MAKRLIDVVAATLGLLLLWPVIAVSMFIVRMGSPGPAIFAQARVGRGGQAFTCYKLRTMYTGTPEVATHEANADRITPFGRLARRLKIDELPQLLNVARADMSLVGPRPCLPSQIELIDERRRLGVLSVRPGITGLAQTRGIDMSDPKRLAAVDAEYVHTRTLLLDIKLILLTIAGFGRGSDNVRAKTSQRLETIQRD